jgi:hypothetical protein
MNKTHEHVRSTATVPLALLRETFLVFPLIAALVLAVIRQVILQGLGSIVPKIFYRSVPRLCDVFPFVTSGGSAIPSHRWVHHQLAVGVAAQLSYLFPCAGLSVLFVSLTRAMITSRLRKNARF